MLKENNENETGVMTRLIMKFECQYVFQWPWIFGLVLVSIVYGLGEFKSRPICYFSFEDRVEETPNRRL